MVVVEKTEGLCVRGREGEKEGGRAGEEGRERERSLGSEVSSHRVVPWLPASLGGSVTEG